MQVNNVEKSKLLESLKAREQTLTQEIQKVAVKNPSMKIFLQTSRFISVVSRILIFLLFLAFIVLIVQEFGEIKFKDVLISLLTLVIATIAISLLARILIYAIYKIFCEPALKITTPKIESLNLLRTKIFFLESYNIAITEEEFQEKLSEWLKVTNENFDTFWYTATHFDSDQFHDERLNFQKEWGSGSS